MLEIRNVKVYGLEESIIASGYPFRTDLPSGFMLNMRITTSFLQLKTIWEQRHNHKLDEWKDFCKFIENLSYFKEICLSKEIHES